MKKLILLTTILLSVFILTAQNDAKPIVKKSVFHGKSKPIRDMDIVLPGTHPEDQRAVNNFFYGKDKTKYNKTASTHSKPNLQRSQGSLKSRGPILNFEGIDNVNGVSPADPNGDVSADYYIQTVNSSFAVWDKSGNMIYGPVDYQTLWDGFPGPWTNLFWGDPVFKYDRLADRWVICTMAFKKNQALFYLMIAVSETSDPLGSYHCYAFEFENMNDYPKLSVWPNAYYITHNMFEPPNWDFLHSLVTAFDREAMLAGEPEITLIEFETNAFSLLPADINGNIMPDDKRCYVTSLNEPDSTIPWHLTLDIFAFDPDWGTPDNSTFNMISRIDVGDFEPMNSFYGPGATQPVTNKNVMTISNILMYPLTYRQFEDHESMVCCLTTWDSEIHYIKWFELRKDNNDWYIYQQGNYAPDSLHRYQPSMSINGNGDIAMGYTVSDKETFPSTRMTGRRANDPLGVMTYQELELFTGLKHIKTYDEGFDQNRWGDYASMMVDPENDSIFWFTNMYPKNEANNYNWGTRIFAINLTEEFENVSAFAGDDTTICQSNDTYLTEGNAINYNAVKWSTSGDGYFLKDNILISEYRIGDQDKIDGQVQLLLKASGYGPGNISTDTMTLIIDDCSGIEELSKNKLDISITPNPTNGITTVKAIVETNTNILLQVYSSQGKLIFTESINSASNILERKLDFSYKENGVYYIRLQTGEQITSGKMVVLR